jgi:hypothetical protein
MRKIAKAMARAVGTWGWAHVRLIGEFAGKAGESKGSCFRPPPNLPAVYTPAAGFVVFRNRAGHHPAEPQPQHCHEMHHHPRHPRLRRCHPRGGTRSATAT